MIKTLKTIIFFGTDNFSLITLKSLVANGYTISAIITKTDKPSGRGHKVHYSPIKQFAIENKIKYFQPLNSSDMLKYISSFDNERIGILSSFGKIISSEVIKSFSYGIINIHPSLLPKYRGPSPVESALLSGDSYTGISIMRLAEQMDAGDIYHQEKIALSKNDTQAELYDKLGKIGSESLIKILPSIINGDLKPIHQDDNHATYCKMITKQDALIKPNQINAYEAERKIRAYSLWPKTHITLNNDKDIIVLASHEPIDQHEIESSFSIRFKDGNYLIIDKVLAKSGKIISGKDYLNGYAN